MRAYDPAVVLERNEQPNFLQSATALAACQGADVLAIMTPWPEFSSISIDQIAESMAGRVIVDPYGVLGADECVASGFSYFKLGLPSL